MVLQFCNQSKKQLNNFWKFLGWPAKLCWQRWWRPSWGTQYTSRPPRSRLFLRNHHRAVEDKPWTFVGCRDWSNSHHQHLEQYLTYLEINIWHTWHIWRSIFCTNGTYEDPYLTHLTINIWQIWHIWAGPSIFGNFDQILTINIFFLSKTGRREKQQKQRCAHLEFNGDLQWWWWSRWWWWWW